MFTDSTDQLTHHRRSGGLDLKSLVDGTGQIFLAHTKLDLGLFLEREVLGEEINELLRGLSSEGATDDFERGSGGLEGVECFEMCDGGEGLEVLDLFLNLID